MKQSILHDKDAFYQPKIVIKYTNGIKHYAVYNNAEIVEEFTDEAEATKFKLELLKLKNGK